jgi:hypothetical protein
MMGFNECNQVSKLQLELSEMNGFLQLTIITMITPGHYVGLPKISMWKTK